MHISRRVWKLRNGIGREHTGSCGAVKLSLAYKPCWETWIGPTPSIWSDYNACWFGMPFCLERATAYAEVHLGPYQHGGNKWVQRLQTSDVARTKLRLWGARETRARNFVGVEWNIACSSSVVGARKQDVHCKSARVIRKQCFPIGSVFFESFLSLMKTSRLEPEHAMSREGPNTNLRLVPVEIKLSPNEVYFHWKKPLGLHGKVAWANLVWWWH